MSGGLLFPSTHTKKTNKKIIKTKTPKIECFTKQRAQDRSLRAYLHGGGGPQVGEVTCCGSPHLTRKCDQIKKRDYMDRRVTPPKRVTSPTWGPPPLCKQTAPKLLEEVLTKNLKQTKNKQT